MTDTIRLLMNIAIATAGSCHDTMTRLDCGWGIRTTFGEPAPQFLPVELCETLGLPLQAGDIIRCETNRGHAWSISEFVEIGSVNGGSFGSKVYVCRLIGGDDLCNVHNESLSVLRYMPKHLLYKSDAKRMYDWGHRAFNPRYNKNAKQFKRCGGVDVRKTEMTVWSRPHIFMQSRRTEGEAPLYAQPRQFNIPWNKKTRLQDIVDAMCDQGFGLDYEYATTKPTEGMGGCAKFTKDSLTKALESSAVNLKKTELTYFNMARTKQDTPKKGGTA